LTPEQFRVTRTEETEDPSIEILYTARHSEKDECYGYIRFSGQHGHGVVDITNKNGRLELEHLELGPTGKQDVPNLAGEHGDGLKVALLVLGRDPQGHHIRFHASGFTWSFCWRKRSGKLGIELSRMSEQKREKFMAQSEKDFAEGLVPFTVDPSRDVQILIGTKGNSLNEHGMLTKRRSVPVGSFLEWCKVAAWLQAVPEADVVETGFGSLYLDKLCGNIYLKGLLLRESEKGDWMPDSASLTGKPLRFGYDFRQGRVNRDRQAINNSTEEAKAILSIWDEAIRKKPELVEKLHEMLLTNSKVSDSTKFADVESAAQLLDSSTASKLWTHLREQNKWYYNHEQLSQVCFLKRIVRSDLFPTHD
jgi:hypothetical protein